MIKVSDHPYGIENTAYGIAALLKRRGYDTFAEPGRYSLVINSDSSTVRMKLTPSQFDVGVLITTDVVASGMDNQTSTERAVGRIKITSADQGAYDLEQALESVGFFGESIDEDAKNPKKKRRKRVDPAKSRAAKKAANKPGAKRNRAKARKKYAKSGEGRQFYKKLGKFNSRRSMTKTEGGMKWNALAIQEFLNADPPHRLRLMAEAIRNDIQGGRCGWRDISDKIDKLADIAEGSRPIPASDRVWAMQEAANHIESKKKEADKLEKQLTDMAKKAEKAVNDMLKLDMGFGSGHGYDRYVGSTSPNVATFYVKLDRLDVPELANPDIMWELIADENEFAIGELNDMTGWTWHQVGRSGGHLLVDVGYAPVGGELSRDWEEEPGADRSSPTALMASEIEYARGMYDIPDSDDPEDWVTYVDMLDGLMEGITEWLEWVRDVDEKLTKAEQYIKSYMSGIAQSLLDTIEANEYELADPEEWIDYFKSPIPDSMR